MPQFPEIQQVAVTRGGVTAKSTRAYLYRIIEEGGGLFTPGLVPWEKPGTIVGTVMDSTGRAPLRETVVSLSGTPYSVEVDSSGGFRFDSIPSGAYTLIASHRSYAGFGQLVDDEPLNMVAGSTYRSRMIAPNTSALVSILCDGKIVKPPDATLRVQLTHIDSGSALKGLRVWLRWPDRTQRPKGYIEPVTGGTLLDEKLLGLQSLTDQTGAVNFCGVPSDIRLELVMLLNDDDPEIPQNAGVKFHRIGQFIVRPGELSIRTTSARPPKEFPF